MTSCNGPERSIVNSVTEQCTCMSEWYMHSCVIYFSLAVIIYTSLNVSRYNIIGVLCHYPNSV